jgi:hypothetical protein
MTHRFKTCCAVFAVLALAAPGSARAFGVYPFLTDPAVIRVGADRVEVLDLAVARSRCSTAPQTAG